MYVYHDINMQKLSLYIGCLDLFIVIKHGAGSLAELCGFVNCFLLVFPYWAWIRIGLKQQIYMYPPIQFILRVKSIDNIQRKKNIISGILCWLSVVYYFIMKKYLHILV